MPSENLAPEAPDQTLEAAPIASEATVTATEVLQPESNGEARPTLAQQLAQAEAEAARNLDGWQRTLADFANARRRMDKQLSEAYINARVEIATRLLPVLDDLALAMQSVPEVVAREEWFTGLQLVERKFNAILEGIHIERIVSVGAPFDPTYHEALMQEQSAEYPSGVVAREFQTGYKIGNYVIRPARVCVAA